FCFIVSAPSCHAHPMGNFSVNHYSRITLTKDVIEIRYILDLAEIPAYQEMQQYNIVADVNDSKALTFVASRGEEFKQGLRLKFYGAPMALRLISQEVIFPPGAGGLPTIKMGFTFRARYPDGAKSAPASLTFEDQNYGGHRGWKEIIVTAPEGTLIN